jgi:hypothetical protein
VSISQSVVVQRVRFFLGDMPWETTGTTTSASGEIIVDDGEEWARGNTGEFDDGDTFWVRDRDGDTLTATRGYYGSTPIGHAEGSRIFKDPRFRYVEIINAISSVIQTLPYPRVYRVLSDTFTPDAPTTVWYGLQPDAIALVRVSQLDGTTNERVSYYSRNRGHLGRRVIFESTVPASLAAATVALRFPDGFADDANTVYVDYAGRITDTVDIGAYTDLDSGAALTEAVIYGAVALLQDSMELRKPRRPSPDTAVIQGGQLFEGRYRRALSHAERDIRAKDPLLDTWKGPM